MTIDDIARTLPNGFHDAEVSTITLNYSADEAVLRMDVWIGDLYSTSCETYRTACLTLSGLIFCVIEPPNTPGEIRGREPLCIDTGSVESLSNPPETKLPSESIEGSFTNWIYVRHWNSFIYISAEEARLDWEGEPVDRG
jgi:hypothetical protein